MSQYNAIIEVYGQGEAYIIYYDDKRVAVDQEAIKTVQPGAYKFSLAMHLLYKLDQTNRYSFSVQNKSLLNMVVKWRGTTTDVTNASNIAFDFLNGTTFTPTAATGGPPQLTAGNLVLLSQP
ncbi:hypothetical protein CPB97_000890 [Podila verticillata]|nr:hypothetical protein CPB97_000890 [Podila verticillata]